MTEQSLIYRSGDAFLPSHIVEFLHTYLLGNDDSVYYINLWSLMHLLSGLLFAYFTSYDIYVAVGLHTLWEMWQIYIKMTQLDLRGLIDIANDTLFFVLGYLLLRRFV